MKLPTYLASGLDVVSTPFGLRGFDRLAPFVVAAGVEGFAGALRGAWPSREGRDAALAAYSWQAQAGHLHAAYRDALDARRRAA